MAHLGIGESMDEIELFKEIFRDLIKKPEEKKPPVDPPKEDDKNG